MAREPTESFRRTHLRGGPNFSVLVSENEPWRNELRVKVIVA